MKVAIVGGGVAGLACALELRGRGHEVVVLEREPRAGGKVGTEHVDSAIGRWQVERGPIGVLDSAPETAELLERLALPVLPSGSLARRRYLMLEGKLREVPDGPKILLSSVLSMREKMRVMAEPLASKPPAHEETVRAFAERRVGASVAARFVEPVVGGIYAGDWAQLSYPATLPKIAELEREHGSLLKGMMHLEKARKAEGKPRAVSSLLAFGDGMGALPQALAAALGAALEVGREARALAAEGKCWRIDTAAGPVAADRVVLATPPDDAARLVAPVDAPMSEALGAIPVNSIAAVSLGYRTGAIAHPLDGFGYLVPRREGTRILGTIFITSTFPDGHRAPPGHVLLRCLLGGGTDPRAVTLDDATLVEIAERELHAAVGVSGAPVFTHVLKWPRAIAQYTLGHGARVSVVEQRGEPRGLYMVGAALRGVGVNDVVKDAKTMAARIAA